MYCVDTECLGFKKTLDAMLDLRGTVAIHTVAAVSNKQTENGLTGRC